MMIFLPRFKTGCLESIHAHLKVGFQWYTVPRKSVLILHCEKYLPCTVVTRNSGTRISKSFMMKKWWYR